LVAQNVYYGALPFDMSKFDDGYYGMSPGTKPDPSVTPPKPGDLYFNSKDYVKTEFLSAHVDDKTLADIEAEVSRHLHEFKQYRGLDSYGRPVHVHSRTEGTKVIAEQDKHPQPTQWALFTTSYDGSQVFVDPEKPATLGFALEYDATVMGQPVSWSWQGNWPGGAGKTEHDLHLWLMTEIINAVPKPGEVRMTAFISPDNLFTISTVEGMAVRNDMGRTMSSLGGFCDEFSSPSPHAPFEDGIDDVLRGQVTVKAHQSGTTRDITVVETPGKVEMDFGTGWKPGDYVELTIHGTTYRIDAPHDVHIMQTDTVTTPPTAGQVLKFGADGVWRPADA